MGITGLWNDFIDLWFLYLLHSLLHIREALHLTRKKEHSLARIANSVIFALALLGFSVIALHGA